MALLDVQVRIAKRELAVQQKHDGRTSDLLVNILSGDRRAASWLSCAMRREARGRGVDPSLADYRRAALILAAGFGFNADEGHRIAVLAFPTTQPQGSWRRRSPYGTAA